MRAATWPAGRDLGELARGGRLGGAVGREAVVGALLDVLARWRRNVPVLVGEAGSGRTAVYEQLAVHLAERRPSLPFSRVVEISVPDLLRERAPAERLAAAFEAAWEAGDTLVLLDDAHVLWSLQGDFPMTLRAVRRALAHGRPRLALTTTPEGWERAFAGERGRLVRVALPGLDASATAALLALAAPAAEAHYNLRLPGDALDALAGQLAGSGQVSPGAVLDALDELAAHAAERGRLDPADAALRTRPTPRGPALPGVRDLSELAAAGCLRPSIGRDRELAALAGALSRRTAALPILVGERGCGRGAILEHLALQAHAGDLPRLRGAPLLEVRLATLMAREHPQQRLHEVVAAARVRGGVLILRDVASLLSTEGSLPLTAAELRAVLDTGEVPVVLVATPGDHARWLSGLPAIAERGLRVNVDGMPAETTAAVLQRARPELEAFYGVRVEESACLALARAAEADRAGTLAMPGRALKLFDEACARAAGGLLNATDVARLAAPVHLPALRADARVADLEAELAATLVGQDRAIRQVARRLRLTRLELDAEPDRPDGIFLFVGPSGVGKTLLARTLARALYASEDAFLHLDMSEYAEPHAVARLAGAPPGYVGHESEPRLMRHIRNRPRSVVLFDEIEKAHPQVLLLLLQVLDGGRLTDTRGFTADFRKATIVMTSNLGRELFGDRFLGRRVPGFGDGAPTQASPRDDAWRTALLRTLPAEFVGRVPDVVVFDPLGRDALLDIARRRIEEIVARVRGHGKQVVMAPGVAEAVVDRGLDPALGARQLVSALDAALTAPLAEHLFSAAWTPGRRAVVRVAAGEVIVDLETGASEAEAS